MNYENYLSNLKGNVVAVSRAVKGGVVLSRLEHFDYLFKKELMIAEGMRSQRRLLNKLINNATSIDYRLARFFANGFKEMFETIEKGYSVKGLEKQYKSMIRTAYAKYICSKLFKINITDNNGIIRLELSLSGVRTETFEIKGMEDYISFSIYLLSLLGSYDEPDNGYKEWFGYYLPKEFNKIKNNVEPTPFIENKNVAKDLSSYISSSLNETCISKNEGKVIPISNNMI
ncbi:hypothetical protein ACEE21_14840 [Clostridium baratii]